ncbi:MAG TPA: squalene/phytoene synthase family protein, partial [Polyangiales bacterium]
MTESQHARAARETRASQRASQRASIEQHSKSFALASRLLPSKVNHDASVLYAYCRRADDAIDLSPPNRQLTQLRALRSELAAIYDGATQDDPLL